MAHAGLWHGTPESFVDLNPAGFSGSAAYATDGTYQVGYASGPGQIRAGLWQGTPDSWVNLSAFLPANYATAYAQGVSSDGTNLYVVGWALNTTTVQYEAVLWQRPIPAPAAAWIAGLGALIASRRRRG